MKPQLGALEKDILKFALGNPGENVTIVCDAFREGASRQTTKSAIRFLVELGLLKIKESESLLNQFCFVTAAGRKILEAE
jgi:hypothetical protein